MIETKQEILIGRGRLTWDRSERVSDRYGFVYLIESGDSLSRTVKNSSIGWNPDHIGLRARIKASILETRQSTHIGDLFRNVYPSTPEIGDMIVLGVGLLSVEPNSNGPHIGLRPFDDDRSSDWLDINALYRCHEQTVQLSYEILEGA